MKPEHLNDPYVVQLIEALAKRDDRIEALEEIIRVYADPTGGSQEDQDTIMSCHEWWKEEQAALKDKDDE